MPRGRPRKKPYTCPECSEGFERPQALGRHRSARHGVAGSSHSTIAYHRKAARDAEDEGAGESKLSMTCPECQAEFKSRGGLGAHRWNMHGVHGRWYTGTDPRVVDHTKRPRRHAGPLLAFFNEVTKQTNNGDARVHANGKKAGFDQGVQHGVAIERARSEISNIAGAFGLAATDLASWVAEVFQSETVR